MKLKCKNCICPLKFKEVNGVKVYFHKETTMPSEKFEERVCMVQKDKGKLTTHQKIFCGCDKAELKTK